MFLVVGGVAMLKDPGQVVRGVNFGVPEIDVVVASCDIQLMVQQFFYLAV